MPNKERYAKDRAYYQAYQESQKNAEACRRRTQKRIAEGKCRTCGKGLIEGAYAITQCVNCIDTGTKNIQLRREILRGTY